MIWCARCSRSDFLAWLAGEPALREFEFIREPISIVPKKGTLVLGWNDRPNYPGALPVFALVRSDEMRDFLAWVTTYLGGFKPFTSLVRVLDEEGLIRLSSATPSPKLAFTEAAWAGAIIGEALEAAGGRLNIDGLSVRACSSSYLFSCARSTALWKESSVVVETASRWERVRQIARGEVERAPFSKERESAARTLAAWQWPLESKEGVGATIVSGAARGALFEVTMSAIGNVVPEVARYLAKMQGPREERIRAFELSRDILARAGAIDSVQRSIFLAALLSVVGPGSMDYIELAMAEASRFPGLLIWYGVFAGSFLKSTLLSEFEGFGRRIAKELQYGDGLSDRPRCDISLAELEVLVNRGRIPKGWRVANPGTLTVEIQPTIYVTFPWPPQVAGSAELIPRRTPSSSADQLGLSYSSSGSGREPNDEVKSGSRGKKKRQR